MKITFQIIHNYQVEPLKVIGNALHLSLQDDLYIELDLRTTLDFLKITLNKTLHSNEQLCFFEIEIDANTYDLSKYDDFINGFLSRLNNETGFVRLVKFIDELRNIEYQKYYNEVAEIEMKLREVFSYIFYNRYLVDEVDDLNEYVVRFPADPPKKTEYIERLENPFYYFTFNGYREFFQKPRDIPFDLKDFKDLISKIRNTADFEALKEILEVKGLTSLKHIDFILGVKEDLDSIEKLRNCIAHNRTATTKVISSYTKSKLKLEQQITDFWNEEIETSTVDLQMTLLEQGSYNKLIILLVSAIWNEETNEVSVQDIYIQDTPIFSFNNLVDFKAYLLRTVEDDAKLGFPDFEERPEVFQNVFNGQRLVDKILNDYKKELVIMEWI